MKAQVFQSRACLAVGLLRHRCVSAVTPPERCKIGEVPGHGSPRCGLVSRAASPSPRRCRGEGPAGSAAHLPHCVLCGPRESKSLALGLGQALPPSSARSV